MRPYAILFLSFLAILLTGCRVPQPTSDSRVVNIGGALVVEVWASTDLAQLGQTVKLRATARNETTHPFSVELNEHPVLDLVISDGVATSRWSEGKPLTTELTQLELKPGESKVIELDFTVTRCCNSVGAVAEFIYSSKFDDDPLKPRVTIFVGSYPYGAFP